MRNLFFILTIIFLAYSSAFANTPLQENLIKLEKDFHGKIGVYAINTHNNQVLAYRENERFPIQSTFKLIGVAAILQENKNLLQTKIYYTKNDLISWCPITAKYFKTGMSLEALAEATMIYSDNLAINLIVKKLGGPNVVVNYARSIGNHSFNVSHYEPDLNSNPNDQHDTSTPKDMAMSLQKLSHQKLLITWMKNNTTGNKKIRAGVPTGWVVADKTGSGSYGVDNDIGILWPPKCQPIILAIYTVQNKKDAIGRDDIVASTTRAVLDEFARTNYYIN